VPLPADTVEDKWAIRAPNGPAIQAVIVVRRLISSIRSIVTCSVPS
jgi:hypothetical protein